VNLADIIATTRDRRALTSLQIQRLVTAATDGTAADYQLAAWLMAVVLNGLSDQETTALTLAMANSGERLDLAGLPKPWLDKHSTGGVGDKTTLVVLPILAACGMTIVKMSGRGLGITGGTIDKLESIPGFRTDLTPEEMKDQAERIGIALSGQTPRLAPADKALYALRDVTGTVQSIPLIVSSILSKKIAGGAEKVVFDVKCGSGAFMKSHDDARALANSLMTIGAEAGLQVACLITDMQQPLGRAVGNALEVQEAIDVLSGKERGRFRKLCEQLAGLALELGGKVEKGLGKQHAANCIDDGSALLKLDQWFQAQGVHVSVVDPQFSLPRAPAKQEVLATARGFVSAIDAEQIGSLVVELGGGRKTKGDAVDPAVGVVLHKEVGVLVEKGEPILTIHARKDEDLIPLTDQADRAIRISSNAPAVPDVIKEVFKSQPRD
jgi:pyrimidine-nucleoside phosphorylase